MLQKLIIHCEPKIVIVDITKITHVCIDDYTTSIHFIDKSKCNCNCNKSLYYFESSLPKNFTKVNRNTIINVDYIEIINKTNRIIQLKNDIQIIASIRKIKLLITHLDEILLRSK